MGFPGGSDGKESACTVGDSVSIPGSGRTPGRGNGSKNQLLVLLIFAMISFVSFAFISALSFKISFLLLTLGFFISSFSSCFRCRVRLFI